MNPAPEYNEPVTVRGINSSWFLLLYVYNKDRSIVIKNCTVWSLFFHKEKMTLCIVTYENKLHNQDTNDPVK